jgi:hypothetical protein
VSSVTRKKLSAKLKGRKVHHRKMSQVARKKLSDRLKGKHHPHKGVRGPHRRRSGHPHRAIKHLNHRRRRRHVSPHRIPGQNNARVLGKLAHRRIRPMRNKVSNDTNLQRRLHRRLLPPHHGQTNRRIIRNAKRKRRRP